MTARCHWDAIVVGAGPAGSLAARELARRGASVLLVDRGTFPRGKICGCCLNSAALAALKSLGLGDLPERLGAIPLPRARLACDGTEASLPFQGVALSREAFDASLCTAAVDAGASLRTGVRAVLGPLQGESRLVHLHTATGVETLTARVVIAANGLAGRLDPTDSEFEPIIVPSSRIGAGVVLPASLVPAFYEAGLVFMAVRRGGYLGMVRLEDGRLDLAGCLDPVFVRESGSLGQAARTILEAARWPCPEAVDVAPWKGTPPLTRQPRRVAGPRWFAIGDAAGYVEPFTGEGMAWAVQSAAAVAPLAMEGITAWDPALCSRWIRVHARLFRGHRLVCRAVTQVLRSSWATRNLVGLLARAPVLSRPFVAAWNRPVASFKGACA